MTTLNEDVLRHIVTFISSETLDRINGCNPVFFEAWMKSRYATISVTKRDKQSKSLLAHLLQPHVATHVKRIHISPWLVQPRTKSPRSLTENLLVRFFELLDPHYTKKKAEKRLQKRLQKDIELITLAFRGMKNVTDYEIHWDDTRGYHPEFYRAFLSPFLEEWSLQLVNLSIKVPPSPLDTIARIRLPNLETLTYHFSTGKMSCREIDNAHDGFVVFVNNLKDSLRSLTFISTNSSQELDISRIIKKLGVFPSLSKVSLSIPYDGGHLADPLSFVQFVEKHRSKIEKIELFTSRCTIRSKPSHPDFVNWIHRIIAAFHEPFPHLRSLGVALRPLRSSLTTLTEFLHLHRTTLTSVILKERPVEQYTLDSLFADDSLKLSLKHLEIKADVMSAYRLADLARLFPNLTHLRVECDGHRQEDHFLPGLIEYQYTFAGWGLQSLSIPLEADRERQVEQYLPRHLPCIKVNYFTSVT